MKLLADDTQHRSVGGRESAADDGDSHEAGLSSHLLPLLG